MEGVGQLVCIESPYSIDMTTGQLFGSSKNAPLLTRSDVERLLEERGTPYSLRMEESNLAEADLSFLVLSGADFASANLQGASLRGADIRKANFSYSDLREANAFESIGDRAHFFGASLQLAEFSRSSLLSADFRDAHVEGAQFQASRLRSCRFAHADIESTSFRYADLQNADFRDATLSDVDFAHARLVGADLRTASPEVLASEELNLSGALITPQQFEYFRSNGVWSASRARVVALDTPASQARKLRYGEPELYLSEEHYSLLVSVNQRPLQAGNLARMISAIDDLHVRASLIAKGDLVGLLDYALTRSTVKSSVIEPLVITWIEHRSPAEVKFEFS